MAGQIYDHIAGLIAIGIIFISSVFIIANLSYVNVLYVDQQQLRNTALETLKAILLEPGYPANWGSGDSFDQGNVTRFGLAHSDSSSFYVLDSDKVQRLVEGNPIGYVEYEKMRELMDLRGYGFSIRIIPPFKVAVRKLSEDDIRHVHFKIKVSHNDGRPIPKAIVKTTIICSTQEEESFRLYVTSANNAFTEALGVCEVDETIEELKVSDVIVILRVTVADITTMMVIYQNTPPEDIADINVVRIHDGLLEIILTMPDAIPRGARWIDNIIICRLSEEGTYESIYNGTRSNDDKLNYGRFTVWSHTLNNPYDDTAFLVFNVWAVRPGEHPARRDVFIAGPHLIGPEGLQYGDASRARSATSAVKLQRAVVISRMTYIAEITLWKEFQ